jgi:transcriptional regulator with XRE-family HTH domain
VARTKHRRIKHRKILGETIRAYRKALGWNQEKLAEKAELDPKYVGEVECGAVNISMDALARIAKSLKIKIHDLTEGI